MVLLCWQGLKANKDLWILVSSTGEVFDGLYKRFEVLYISAYTKNWLESWFDNKELLSGVDAIGWIFLIKKKKKKANKDLKR